MTAVLHMAGPCHHEGEQFLTGWNHEREAGHYQGASTSVDGKEA